MTCRQTSGTGTGDMLVKGSDGTYVYAAPFPEVIPGWPGGGYPRQPFVPTPGIATNILWGLSEEDREMFKRIEEKLDKLLQQAQPEAKQVADIKRRVRKAMKDITGDKP